MSTLGYVPYNPQEEKRYWLERSHAVLVEYQDELPLTVRQIFYRLVASDGYDKTESAYVKLAEMLTRARRASMLGSDRGSTPMIPFSAIRDDKLRARSAFFYEGPDEFKDSILESASGYKLDHQDGQPQHVEMWCEAQGMMPVLAGIAEPYSIRVSSSGGYDSITTKHNLARRVAGRWDDEKKSTLLLHVGDFDGSGEDMFNNLTMDVGMMVHQLTGASTEPFATERVALTAEQVVERNVITAPPKPSDSRTKAFVERHWEVVDWHGDTDISAQLEALTPTDLRELFEEVITGHLDMDAYQEVLDREGRERDAFSALLRDIDLDID
jgi:hypothetical protein